MNKLIAIAMLALLSLQASAKDDKKDAPKPPAADTSKPKSGIMSFSKFVAGKKLKKGLFNVYQQEDKWYFEIPENLLDREMIVTTRFSKIAGGGGKYAGELDNEQTIRWERGPSKNIFLRVITTISLADSTNEIYKAVTNSNLDPIAYSFPIKAVGKDSGSVIIDVTEFFKGDNQPVSISLLTKRRFNLSAQQADKSYISSINSYPINTEVKTVRTFTSTPSFGPSSPSPFPTVTLPAAYATGAVTLEMNNSFIVLPRKPMKRRFFDSRVGFFADEYTVFGDEQQKTRDDIFIVRWKLEPKEEDMEKWKRGELVEPKKPIVYYIDPATPKKWRKYLIMGVNDWQAAFERAGFKNAIMAKEWPADSNMNLEDARYSVIRYLPSDIANAYGPNVHDPRSGEILESHIGWYHNVMKLVHDWYMTQTAAVDPNARKMKFDDSLMGQLIRFVSSHEVGHTLGLRHNMGSSSRTPVELLRNKAWVEAHGHTASIMDYARFNYVAQPEDNISEAGLFPRIGEYDKWAIQWGYKASFTNDDEAEKNTVNKWIIDSLKANPRLWFGTETNPFDPRSQTEDLGDNAMKASEYGLKNLKRIVIKLNDWTKEEGDRYENLDDMYSSVTDQYRRYMNHVLKNVGGVYETPKSVEEAGDVYEPTPKAMQKQAVAFLNKNLFETPYWLLDKSLINKISNPVSIEIANNTQITVLYSLLSGPRLNRLAICANRFGAANTYSLTEMMDDVKKGVWSELATKKPIDGYRRNLQKAYVEALINLTNPTEEPQATGLPPALVAMLYPKNMNLTDVTSVARGELTALRAQLLAAIPTTADRMSKYHMQDVAERIKRALYPKG